MITNFLPTFKVVEPNKLTGLRIGHVLAQSKADAAITVKTVNENAKFIENGLIVGLSATGTIENYSKDKHPVMFLHYTEELNTYLDELKYFAVEMEDGVAYPRAVALYIGDVFTTNNYTGEISTAKYAKVGANGVLVLQTAADVDTAFIATKSTLPDGSDAVEFELYRIPTTA